jgi:hypothetical protein
MHIQRLRRSDRCTFRVCFVANPNETARSIRFRGRPNSDVRFPIWSVGGAVWSVDRISSDLTPFLKLGCRTLSIFSACGSTARCANTVQDANRVQCKVNHTHCAAGISLSQTITVPNGVVQVQGAEIPCLVLHSEPQETAAPAGGRHVGNLVQSSQQCCTDWSSRLRLSGTDS